MRGGNGEVVAQLEVLVNTNENLLQFDDVRLQLDLHEVIATCVRFAYLLVCAVVCRLNLRRCVADEVVLVVIPVLYSSVKAPTNMALE